VAATRNRSWLEKMMTRTQRHEDLSAHTPPSAAEVVLLRTVEVQEDHRIIAGQPIDPFGPRSIVQRCPSRT